MLYGSCRVATMALPGWPRKRPTVGRSVLRYRDPCMTNLRKLADHLEEVTKIALILATTALLFNECSLIPHRVYTWLVIKLPLMDLLRYHNSY